MTMTLVSTVTVGSGGAASIEFTGIAGTGKDLLVKLSARNTGTGGACQVTLNSDTTDANYTLMYLQSDGSTATTASTNSRYLMTVNPSSYTANTFGNSELYISNYTSAVAKSTSVDGVNENNSTSAFATIRAWKWSGTSAITTIKLEGLTSFAQYSTASLYIIS